MNNIEIKHVVDFHKWTRPGPEVDIGIFANILPDGDGYIGAARCGAMDIMDQIHIVTYDSEFNLLDSKKVTKGEDPRCFFFGGTPYALTWSPEATGLEYKVVNLKTREVTNLLIDGVSRAPLSKFGKNWMPLEKDGQLYIIVSLEPKICVLHCDLETGNCQWVEGFEADGDIQVTLSRGGTPFIYNETLDRYIGFGHRSYSAYHHNIYFYTISTDFKSVTIGEDIYTEKINVQDPLSIFSKNDKIYFCVGNWNVPDDGEMNLYELTISN